MSEGKALGGFQAATVDWFSDRFAAPTRPQERAWPLIRAGRHVLIAAPTGSGKTLAAFLSVIDDLVGRAVEGTLRDETRAVYVSPLKALSNDIQRNLQEPLAGIAAGLARRGHPDLPIRTLVRTGDTPAAERAAMTRRPPHIVVTTPESLYLMLTSEGGRRMLSTTRTVIVDEIHAVLQSKRGSHLALSLERLEALVAPAGPLQRIGLSATQRPIEEVARFLVGAGASAGTAPTCEIVDEGHLRELDLAIEVPGSPLSAVMAGEVWTEIYDRLAALIGSHRTTLVFVNTRRMAERLARHLSERLGEETVSSHHGSMARDRRLDAESRLKEGRLRALVATASLELGIDIGSVDLVCQIGSTRSIGALLQRVGRSGHTLGGFPKGRLFPLSRDELVEAAALLDAVRQGELDRLVIPQQPLDILAQQIVAAVACEEWREDDLYALVRRAAPYRALPRSDFDEVVAMLSEGFTTRRGRQGAMLHRDAVNGRLRARRGARLTALTSGGAIPDMADYDVVLEPSGSRVGTVNEDFAIESLPGDIFQLGNTSWRILRIEPGKVRVEDAAGQPPNIPFWFGEAPSRSAELSLAVSRLRGDIGGRILTARADAAGEAVGGHAGEIESAGFEAGRVEAVRQLVDGLGVAPAAADQIADYLGSAVTALGIVPTQETLVIERFFDETGGMQLVIHSPFGSRLNRAWGLALRKRFCRKFNFELQAAATEDAIVLSLGPTHSFPLEEVPRYLRSGTVRPLLVQAMLLAPMFTARWRWNVTRALAVPRWRGGRKVAPQLQRWNADDLLALIFPDQAACAENLAGDREIPDHPLVNQTVRDCLEEAMDIDALESLLASLERGERRIVVRDLRAPSPLAQEILTARPYAFLDDAPLEERRTQAVISRRWLDPRTAADLGTLDAAAIDRVREEAWPLVRSADELHEALELLGFITAAEGGRGHPAGAVPPADGAATADGAAPTEGWSGFLDELIADARAGVLTPAPARADAGCDGKALWIAAERLPEIALAYPAGHVDPPIDPPASLPERTLSPEDAVVELLRGRLEVLGPVTATRLAATSALGATVVARSLAALESEGFVLRGRFTPGGEEEEWCSRRLLSRIHRYTLDRLRSEIRPVPASEYLRFLFEWQHVEAVTSEEAPERAAEGGRSRNPGAAAGSLDGPASLAHVLEQLEGFEAPAASWEEEILPTRLPDYDPTWLDGLCLSGRIVWQRLSPPQSVAGGADGSRTRGRAAGPIRTTPITLFSRSRASAWGTLAGVPRAEEPPLTAEARAVRDLLLSRGASFFSEIVSTTGLLRTQVENALGELASAGLATSDGFAGLRALLAPPERRSPISRTRRRRGPLAAGMDQAGRWSLLHRDSPGEGAAEPVETVARTMLRRYGVLIRRLLDREGTTPPWRDLLGVLRRLEARGEIRGGRFVDGFAGEQFALPEAVTALRALRHRPGRGELLSVSAADPLNLVGIVTPGGRLPATPANRVLYRDGVPIALKEAGEVRFLTGLEPAAEWKARNVLLRRRIPPGERLRHGRPA